jgi:hypothetical protein
LPPRLAGATAPPPLRMLATLAANFLREMTVAPPLTGRVPSIIFPAPWRLGSLCAVSESKDTRVVSSTKQTTRRRILRSNQRGRWNKAQGPTPAFPIHPAGYDASAPDAKPVAAPAAAVQVAKPKAAPKAKKTTEGGASR